MVRAIGFFFGSFSVALFNDKDHQGVLVLDKSGYLNDAIISDSEPIVDYKVLLE